MVPGKIGQLIHERVVILDGAMGTALQKSGMPPGVCPEQWILDNPQVSRKIQTEYLEAGSDIIYSPTFGANRVKLGQFGMADQTFEINRKLASLSKEVASSELVAGDISSTGQYLKPFGDLDFEDAIEIFKQQVSGLLAGGVDLFVIETMMDIQETRAALIAVKETTDLPVFVSLSFELNQLTLTGTDPITALVTLESLGATGVGCNCSTGPSHMVEILKKIKPYAKKPLLVKPNAGLPQLVDGETVFPLSAKHFGEFVPELIQAGANLIGGCCGTSPDYIREISKQIAGVPPKLPLPTKTSVVTSARGYQEVSKERPTIVIGERINPTGKPELQKELNKGKMDLVYQYATDQIASGSHILDINVGMPSGNEQELMIQVIESLSTKKAPLSIDSMDFAVVEAALRRYPGRALVNSISLDEDISNSRRLLKVCAKYGAMLVLMPVKGRMIPHNLAKRQQITHELLQLTAEYGFGKEDVIIDGLVMTAASHGEQARETLKMIDWCTNTLDCHTVIGLSNISFGLPSRPIINSAFLAMAISNGLTTVIANPCQEGFSAIKLASDFLTAKSSAEEYITTLKEKNN